MSNTYESGICRTCGGYEVVPETSGAFGYETQEFSPEVGKTFEFTGEQEQEFPMTSLEFPTELEREQEIIHKVDARRHITDTTKSPFKQICKLELTFVHPRTGATSRGGCSGALVAPNKVLTAAHCIYGIATGNLATQVRVIPGKNGPGRSHAEEPFGFAFAKRLNVPAGWRSSPAAFSPFDYAVITLDRPIGSRVGGPYFRLAEEPDKLLLNNRVNTAGYPGDKGGNLQYLAYDRIVTTLAQRIEFLHDAWWGQSGSAIWVRWQNVRWIVGILTTVDDPSTPIRANTGTRISRTNLGEVRGWINA